jgi:hypothetical protein
MSFRGLQAQIDKVQPGDMGDTMYREAVQLSDPERAC